MTDIEQSAHVLFDRVLTNSLGSTDVAAVHAGYGKRRKALLRAGLAIYELKPVKAVTAWVARGKSSASLHAKTFEIDGRYVYVGSFNFDPRSAYLDTEMDLLLDSPQLAPGSTPSLKRRCRTVDWRL